MKKNINIKIFMQSHVKNVQFAAVTVMGLGIALFCSGYTVPEGCTPSVTVSCNAGAGSCIAAATTATCVGDDASDSVTASNSLNTSFTYNLNNLSVTGRGCYTTTWSNLVDIQFAVTGVNKITATSAELQMTSSAADLVVHSDGCVWNYVNGGKSYSPDLLSMPIYISCFPSGEMLQVYETPGTEWVAGCLGSWIIRMTDFGDDDYKYPDANGDIGIGDRLQPGYQPTYSSSCTDTVPKTWHVYSRLGGDLTTSDDTITFQYSTTSPVLTISDSQGPSGSFSH